MIEVLGFYSQAQTGSRLRAPEGGSIWEILDTKETPGGRWLRVVSIETGEVAAVPPKGPFEACVFVLEDSELERGIALLGDALGAEPVEYRPHSETRG